MSKIKFYFIVLISIIAISSCNKNNDDIEITPPRPFAEQYPKDIDLIESYLENNYIEVINNPGETNDQDVLISKLDENHTVSIKDQKEYQLLERIVKLNKIEYKIYYLVLREGTGLKPCNVDEVLTSYDGHYLAQATTGGVVTATDFENVIFPKSFMSLYDKIRGWKEIFPQFKTGKSTPNTTNGTITYTDFGAGVMFIPSGLAYYNSGKGSIPSYSPLVFSFKLYDLKRSDLEYKIVGGSLVSDPDGVLSYNEDINRDGYMWTQGELPDDTEKNPDGTLINPDDTDGDGIPDFLDFDDDGDTYATKGEVKNANGETYSFEFIPDCDGFLPTNIKNKRHLDKNCHKMNQ